ncbi:MAG: hypothetical protein WA941_08225 [Nitrososphaeraceae archaeon]
MIRNAKQTLEWRRSKVLELSSEGRSQSEISRILQVSVATINTDMQYLRQEAKEKIHRYIDEQLPFEYHKCLVGLDAIVCKMSDIVNNAESDSRDVLQATNVKMQAYAMKIDLLSNATVIEKAIKFVDMNLMCQNKEVTIDDTAESIQDIR